MIYAYIAAALIAAGLGGLADHFIEHASYNKLQAQFDGYKAQESALTAQQQAAYAEGLAKQLAEFQGTVANNAKVLKDLQDENQSVAADRDFARRLLNAARAPAANPPAPTSAGGGPGAASVPADPGNGSLAGDLADAAGECRDSMQRLAALQDEVIPQLRSSP